MFMILCWLWCRPGWESNATPAPPTRPVIRWTTWWRVIKSLSSCYCTFLYLASMVCHHPSLVPSTSRFYTRQPAAQRQNFLSLANLYNNNNSTIQLLLYTHDRATTKSFSTTCRQTLLTPVFILSLLSLLQLARLTVIPLSRSSLFMCRFFCSLFPSFLSPQSLVHLERTSLSFPWWPQALIELLLFRTTIFVPSFFPIIITLGKFHLQSYYCLHAWTIRGWLLVLSQSCILPISFFGNGMKQI